MTFTFDRGIARVTAAGPPELALEFDQLRPDRRTGDISAEITVSVDGKELHSTRLNLTSTQGRSSLAKHLAVRAGAKVDWLQVLDEACMATIRAQRAGQPAILLREAQRPPDAGWLLRPLILGGHPSILFADGGTGKSYLGLAAALDLHTGSQLLGMPAPVRVRVGIFDWEMTEWEHKGRMRKLLPGVPESDLPDIVYQRCQAPLREEVERLRRTIRDFELGYVIIDSVALACDGPPEEAQSALGFFEALRRLEVGALCIAHVNKQGDTERPFGSAFWHNSARSTWYAKGEQDGDTIRVGLFNRKQNLGAKAAPLGFTLTFDELRVTIARTDVRDMPAALAGQVSNKDRIAHALRGGPKTYIDLSDELEIPVDTVRITAGRNPQLFVKLTDGIHRIALRAHGSQTERTPPNTTEQRSPGTERTHPAYQRQVFGSPVRPSLMTSDPEVQG